MNGRAAQSSGTVNRPLADIDRTLRFIATMRAAARAYGERPSVVGIDKLLDERLTVINRCAKR
jgi:hypothetical protein